MAVRYKKDGTRAKQPGPRPGKGDNRPPPPDHPTNQRSIRLTDAEKAAADAYCHEMGLRTGIRFSWADMVRRGMRLVLAEPLPPKPIVSTCVLVPLKSMENLRNSADSCRNCLQCMRVIRAGDPCPETGLEPGATRDHRA